MDMEVSWDGLWIPSFGFSQFHGHGSWLVCEVDLTPLSNGSFNHITLDIPKGSLCAFNLRSQPTMALHVDMFHEVLHEVPCSLWQVFPSNKKNLKVKIALPYNCPNIKHGCEGGGFGDHFV